MISQLIELPTGEIVSGSADCSLKIWEPHPSEEDILGGVLEEKLSYTCLPHHLREITNLRSDFIQKAVENTFAVHTFCEETGRATCLPSYLHARIERIRFAFPNVADEIINEICPEDKKRSKKPVRCMML
jgi:hypothetical protein